MKYVDARREKMAPKSRYVERKGWMPRTDEIISQLLPRRGN